jgi:hypothetical protein
VCPIDASHAGAVCLDACPAGPTPSKPHSPSLLLARRRPPAPTPTPPHPHHPLPRSYPYNLDFDFGALEGLTKFSINNLGDPFIESNYGVHSREFEVRKRGELRRGSWRAAAGPRAGAAAAAAAAAAPFCSDGDKPPAFRSTPLIPLIRSPTPTPIMNPGRRPQLVCPPVGDRRGGVLGLHHQLRDRGQPPRHPRRPREPARRHPVRVEGDALLGLQGGAHVPHGRGQGALTGQGGLGRLLVVVGRDKQQEGSSFSRHQHQPASHPLLPPLTQPQPPPPNPPTPCRSPPSSLARSTTPTSRPPSAPTPRAPRSSTSTSAPPSRAPSTTSTACSTS